MTQRPPDAKGFALAGCQRWKPPPEISPTPLTTQNRAKNVCLEGKGRPPEAKPPPEPSRLRRNGVAEYESDTGPPKARRREQTSIEAQASLTQSIAEMAKRNPDLGAWIAKAMRAGKVSGDTDDPEPRGVP